MTGCLASRRRLCPNLAFAAIPSLFMTGRRHEHLRARQHIPEDRVSRNLVSSDIPMRVVDAIEAGCSGSRQERRKQIDMGDAEPLQKLRNPSIQGSKIVVRRQGARPPDHLSLKVLV